MSKLNEILTGEMAALLQERDVYISKGDAAWSTRRLKPDIKALMLELLDEYEGHLQFNPECQGCKNNAFVGVPLREKIEAL